MTTDPFDTPVARAWAQRVLAELVPMIDASAVSVSIVPNDGADVKFAVELGISLMLDKPIVLAVVPGRKVPEHLARVADEIIELDIKSPDTSRLVQEAVRRVLDRTNKPRYPAAPRDNAAANEVLRSLGIDPTIVLATGANESGYLVLGRHPEGTLLPSEPDHPEISRVPWPSHDAWLRFSSAFGR